MTRVVDVYAEVCCPFAHVGLRRVTAFRDARGADVVLRVRAWPLELVNGAPLDPPHVAETVGELRESVAPDLFAGYRADALPGSSMSAFVLTAAATRQGLAVGEATALAVRRALFEEGRDVSDPAVLAEVAAETGVAWPPADDAALEASVLAEYEEGRARGVVGSPHFFTAGGDVFCPVLTIERGEGRRRISIDRDAVASFLESLVAERLGGPA